MWFVYVYLTQQVHKCQTCWLCPRENTQSHTHMCEWVAETQPLVIQRSPCWKHWTSAWYTIRKKLSLRKITSYLIPLAGASSHSSVNFNETQKCSFLSAVYPLRRFSGERCSEGWQAVEFVQNNSFFALLGCATGPQWFSQGDKTGPGVEIKKKKEKKMLKDKKKNPGEFWHYWVSCNKNIENS